MLQRSEVGHLAVVLLFFGPFSLLVAGVAVLALLNPRAVFLPAVLVAVLGFALFFGAKLTVLRRGHWLSFGSGAMSRRARQGYQVGYTLMTIGGAGMLLLLLFRLEVGSLHLFELLAPQAPL